MYKHLSQRERRHFFSTQDSASLEPCGVRMKDMNELSVHVNNESIV